MRVDAIEGIPEVVPGNDLAQVLIEAITAPGNGGLKPGDLLVIAQKVVSKAEGRYVRLAEVEPSDTALTLGQQTDKDPRIVELILRESRQVLRHRTGLIVSETHHGMVMANAGIDQSNIRGEDGEVVLMLPLDSDQSAAALRQRLEARFGSPIGVIISDSVGRAWRLGTTGQALGSSGPLALWDLRGELDREGRAMQSSQVGFIDQIASAGALVMGEGAEGLPAARVRGLAWTPSNAGGRDLVRPAADDMFR